MEARSLRRIEAGNISAGYGPKTVIRDVSLSLDSAEVVGIIGPNGAGKSTLLRALSGVLVPTSGTVTVDGLPLEALSSRQRALHIAFVPQSEPAVFEFPVKEIVLMGRHAHVRGLGGESSADFEAAARAMAACDILSLADRPVTSLSGGEHRLVLIARGLAQQAPILLLDEPIAHLDINHQVQILSLARRMADKESTAVLVALHELNLAAEYCDRLILMSDGKVTAEGAPNQVLTPELLERAYGTSVQVSPSPATGKPMVLPLPQAASPSIGAVHVHVICGGATGASLLAQLGRRGFHVTAGVLNRLDSDQVAAEAMNIPHVTEAPFSPIGESAIEECRRLLETADSVIVTEVPIGHGNIANLEIALHALRLGKRVILIESTPFAARDYTDEDAGIHLWEGLLDGGALVVTSTQDAVEAACRPGARVADAR
jgi:iron complex transport system ATP-binding protein